MDVVIKARVLHHDRLGVLKQGQRVENFPDKQAEEFLRRGFVERYETKVVREIPIEAGGRMESSFASPAAPVSAQTTSKPSSDGAKKRGRPKKEASS
jgi:hypothetical protein